jgi:hypothetical protein
MNEQQYSQHEEKHTTTTTTTTMTLLDMISEMRQSLNKLLNMVDRLKIGEKCGDNLSIVVSELQQHTESLIDKTYTELRFIRGFTNTSISYWTELFDLHTNALKLNKKLHEVSHIDTATTTTTTTNTTNTTNNNNTTPSPPIFNYTAPLMRDPNSVFNNIQTSIETIPIVNINEAITSKPKTYAYLDIIEENDEWLLDKLHPSSSLQSVGGGGGGRQSSTVNQQPSLLSQFKTISGKLNTELMATFKDDMNKIEKYPATNELLYGTIMKDMNEVNRVLKLQLESLGYNKSDVTLIMSELRNCCHILKQSILQVLLLINLQKTHSKDYFINTIQYWVKLTEIIHEMTIKIGNLLTHQRNSDSVQPNSSVLSNSGNSNIKPRIKPFF